jgi:hypothetical protein
MSELNAAPGGDGEAITVVPVSDDAPIYPRAAANALTDWRRKSDAEEDKPAEAPPQAAEPEPDSAQAEDAAPAEEATGEQPTETNEPAEELPPIEPPRSWTKEDKEEFKSYPREAQEKIARREQDRETALRRGQNEVAEQRKEAEALRAKLNESLQQYEQATQSALQAVQQATAGEFADIKTPDDINKLANEDPLRFTRYQAHLMNVAQIERAAQLAQEQRAQQFKSQWAEFATKEDAKFLERAPEMADKDKATKIADASVSLLKDVGFSEADLAKLWNGEASVSLRDHRVQLLIRDAARYREAQTTAPKKIAAKPVPPVQRPGVAPSRGAQADLELKHLEKQLNQTGNWKDAAKLLLAKRAVASR